MNKILVKYYRWRCSKLSKQQGILSFSFTTKRQMESFLDWNGHNWKEWREMFQTLKRDRSKDIPVPECDDFL